MSLSVRVACLGVFVREHISGSETAGPVFTKLFFMHVTCGTGSGSFASSIVLWMTTSHLHTMATIPEIGDAIKATKRILRVTRQEPAWI